MFYPHAETRYINDKIGYGVFAKTDIPKGTLVYVKDPLEIQISSTEYQFLNTSLKDVVNKYSYIDERGMYVVSWDIAKYVNHRCDCNTMSSGFGFEIAIKDIRAGEEITDEYGLFNILEEIPLACNCRNCRKVLRPSDIDMYHSCWDKQIKSALKRVRHVPQPLWMFLDGDSLQQLNQYLDGVTSYPSVINLKCTLKDDSFDIVRAVL